MAGDRTAEKPRTAEERRVVVTGIGLVSPLGNSVNSTWERMLKGENGITLLDEPYIRQGEGRVFVAAPVKDFTQNVLDPKAARRAHRAHLFALGAVSEALIDSRLYIGGKLTGVEPEDIGAKIGTGVGGAFDIIKVSDLLRADAYFRQLFALLVEPERVATVPSMAFGLKNSAHASVAACATGSINIIEAFNRIKLNQAQVMVAGSTEAAIQPETLALFDPLGAMSNKNTVNKASAPFDKERDGFVAAEGAGIMVLEELKHAQDRGATIHAELVGVADTSDAGDATSPAQEGQVRAMNKALASANMKPEEIDYVNAHGTGTDVGDPIELMSVQEVFPKTYRDMPISSSKWQIAHLIGAAAAAEAVLCIKMIQEGVIIPNFGLTDPLRDDMNLITQLQHQTINAIMKNSFGFGGINASLIFRRYVP